MSNNLATKNLSFLKQNISRKVDLNIVKEKLKTDEFITNYQKMYNKVKDNLIKFQNTKSSREIILSTELTYLFPNVKTDKFFDCYFFKGNIAWISEKNNHYRYFSRHYNGKIISFDLIDFTMLYFNLNSISEVINKFIHTTNVTSIEKYWSSTQIEKYRVCKKYRKNTD